MAERNVSVDHVTIWRWVQRYAPELRQRCRSELRMRKPSWRVDEIYVRIAGKWSYLYRTVDSSGLFSSLPSQTDQPARTSHGAFDLKLATLPDKLFIVNCLSWQKLGELIGRK